MHISMTFISVTFIPKSDLGTLVNRCFDRFKLLDFEEDI
jgi:hypothetical protein